MHRKLDGFAPQSANLFATNSTPETKEQKSSEKCRDLINRIECSITSFKPEAKLANIKGFLIEALGLENLDSQSILSISNIFEKIRKKITGDHPELSTDFNPIFSELQEKIEEKINLILDKWEASPEAKSKVLNCILYNKPTLDLSFCDLTNIPDFLLEFLKNLQVLDLSGNKLRHFPNIENSQLMRLNLRGNLIEERVDLGKYTALNEVNFQGNPFFKKELIKELKNQAARNGEELSSRIHTYEDLDQDSLVEIAKIAAECNGRGLSKYIQNYKIISQESLGEIAKIAAAQSGRGVGQYIENYGIKEEKILFEVLKIAVRHSGFDVILSFSEDFLSSINRRDLVVLTLAAFAFSVFRKTDEELRGLYFKVIELISPDTGIDSKEYEILSTKTPYEFFKDCIKLKKESICLESPDFEQVVNKLSKFRGKELLGFLLGILILEWGEQKFQRSYNCLTREPSKPNDLLVPRIIPAIIPAKWMAEGEINLINPLINQFSSFLKDYRDKLKENTSLFLSNLLLFLKNLEVVKNISSNRKMEIISKVCQKSNSIEEKFRLISYFAIKSRSDLLNTMPFDDPEQELKAEYNKQILEWFPQEIRDSKSEQELIKKYEETFGDLRVPYALEIYESNLFNSEETVQNTLRRFVISVISDNFYTERYVLDNNPHLQKIYEKHPNILENWKNYTFCEKISTEEKVLFSQEWQDLFLCGTEVVGSCQRVDAAEKNSKCLLAYCLDGKNGMIAVKDEKTGKIVARSMLRLLWDPQDEKPVLFLDKLYPLICLQEKANAIRLAAKECAHSLGVELLENSGGEGREIEALGGPCPYEYADAAEGVMKGGKFRVRAKKVE